MTSSPSSSYTDHFGFVAQEIDAFKVGSFTIPLVPLPHNDLINLGLTNDVTIREI